MEAYFAYGSNISIEQMKERKIRWIAREVAYLFDYELMFNKQGVIYKNFSVANVQPKKDKIVEGILYILPWGELKQLDKYEQGYDKFLVTIRPSHNTALKLKALTYVAKPEFIDNSPVPEGYASKILTSGKDFFSKSYIKEIEEKTKFYLSN